MGKQAEDCLPVFFIGRPGFVKAVAVDAAYCAGGFGEADPLLELVLESSPEIAR